jgi:3'-5' exoribonuclease
MIVNKSQFLKDLKDKDFVSSPFMVKSASLAQDKNGKEYLNLHLMDRSAEAEGKVWEDARRYSEVFIRNSVVFVEGKVQLYQGRKQLVMKSARLRSGDR